MSTRLPGGRRPSLRLPHRGGLDSSTETGLDLSEFVKDLPPLGEANEIYRKLEERAIAESNDLNHRVAQCRKVHAG